MGTAETSTQGAQPSRRLIVIAVLLSALMGSIAWCTAIAAAGSLPSKFVYELCDSALPGGGSPQLRFVVNPGVPVGYFNNCATPGGSIGVQEWGHASATLAILNVAVPATPGGFVESETITGGAAGLGPGNDHSFIYEQGWPANNSGDTQRVFFNRFALSPLGSGGDFPIFWNCDGNYAPGCEAAPTVWAHYITATEVDPKVPTVATQGPMLEPGILRGHQEITATAGDQGGGISKLEVLVNGLPAASPTLGSCGVMQIKNPSYTGTAALTPSPCPARLDGRWTLDTAAHPFENGPNTVAVCASDFSTLTEGNRTCTSASVRVNNTCTDSAVPGGEEISAEFARTHTSAVTVPFRSSARVVGSLSNDAGDAIGGATICVLGHMQGSRAAPRAVGVVTTGPRGHFAYRVAPGPNREFKLGYRHDGFQIAKAVRYFAHAKPTLEITPGKVGNGGEIEMRGKLPGPRAGGRVVVLQASGLGSNLWYTFGEATTNRRGVYHYRYRFDATRTTTVYRFRALVLRQRGYDWLPGHSDPVLVRVKGRG